MPYKEPGASFVLAGLESKSETIVYSNEFLSSHKL